MKNDFKRLDYDFYSNNTRCSAWLYLPKKEEKCPVVVMGQGFGATRGMTLCKLAEHFANAGYACFLFDYRNFGDSDGNKRQRINAKEQLEDWNSAIDFVKALDEVDKNKIIIFGPSFGGGHVITLAAKRTDLSAAIAQCPYIDKRSSIATVPIKKKLSLIPTLILDLLSCLTGYHPVLLKIEGKEDEVCLLKDDEGKENLMKYATKEIGYVNYTPARTLLEFLKYSPGKYAKDIKIPILYAICINDKHTPADKAKIHAIKSPKAVIKEYNCGHFDLFEGKEFETVTKDYIEFLDKIFK